MPLHHPDRKIIQFLIALPTIIYYSHELFFQAYGSKHMGAERPQSHKRKLLHLVIKFEDRSKQPLCKQNTRLF